MRQSDDIQRERRAFWCEMFKTAFIEIVRQSNDGVQVFYLDFADQIANEAAGSFDCMVENYKNGVTE